jgi:energy-coupling factor transporter ATP-binding protein EcfA2
MKHLILITGPKGHGKSTFAAMLRDIVADRGLTVHESALALPLKQMTSAVTGLSLEDLEDRKVKEAYHPRLGMSPREFQITTGQALGCSFFVNAWSHQYDGEDVAIVPDVRFTAEIEGLMAVYPEAKVHLVNVKRHGQTRPDVVHTTEVLGWVSHEQAYLIKTYENELDRLAREIQVFTKVVGL